jgi:hypothetical protein
MIQVRGGIPVLHFWRQTPHLLRVVCVARPFDVVSLEDPVPIQAIDPGSHIAVWEAA